MKLIALTGPARSGKDTVARILAEDLGYQRVAIAEPLKAAYLAIFGDWFPEDGPEKERPLPEIGVSPRYILQTLGTEWGRGYIHQDLWILLARDRVNHHLSRQRPVVITDCRYPNEAAWVRSAGGQIWRIQRQDAPQIRDHESEHGIGIPPDHIIDNNHSIDALRAQVHLTLNQPHWRAAVEDLHAATQESRAAGGEQ